jgi:uncharacterized iron-regulated membrane protein
VLNEREQRILSAIEQGLHRDDPDLRERLEVAPRRRRTPSWRAVAAVLGAVVAVCLVFLGLAGHALVLMAVAAAPWALQRWRTRVRVEPHVSEGTSTG